MAGEFYMERANLLILTPEWMVVFRRKEIPWKVLGLIVEHVGHVPEEGEAYAAQRKETGPVLHALAAELLEKMRREPAREISVCKTNLTWESCNLWQRQADMKMMKVWPDYEEIWDLIDKTAYALGDTGWLKATGGTGTVYIRSEDLRPDEELVMEHLERLQWVAG